MSVAFLVVFGLAMGGPTLARRVRLTKRLRNVGAWFPVVVWGVAIGVVALCLKMAPGMRGWLGALSFTTVLAAPLAAALLTLTWRDARAGVGAAPDDDPPIDPDATVAPGGVRAAAAIIAALGGVTLVLIGSAGAWSDLPAPVAGFVLCAYVAASGRVPRHLARRA